MFFCETLDIAAESIIMTKRMTETERVKVLVVGSESTVANTNHILHDFDMIAPEIENPKKLTNLILCFVTYVTRNHLGPIRVLNVNLSHT